MPRSVLSAFLGLAAAACLASAAHAQAAAPAAPPVDPAKLALAQQVLEASGGVKGAETQVRALYGSMAAGISQTLPKEHSETTELVMRDVQEETIKLIPRMIEISARAYAQNLSETELRDLLAFYRTESGKAVLQKMPVIMQQTMAAEMPMIQAMVPQMMQKAVDRACEESKCTAEEKQIIAAAMASALKRPKS
jgi:hypothetical protein